MGGRGIPSGADIRQVTIEQIEDRLEVDEIVKNAEIVRNLAVIKLEEDKRIPILYKKCFCCGEFTIPLHLKYEKCHVCGWIDDEFQNNHIFSEDGMNDISLNEARKLFFGLK
jgi:hypothetical protein